MNIGMYQNAASLTALERLEDAVSQNISASQVPGYKERIVNFSSQDSGQFNLGSDGNGGPESQQPASFPQASNAISFKPGQINPTGNTLDLAIQGSGFFQVQMPDGTTAYSRNGSFSLRTDGTLVNGNNYPVLGESGNPIIVAQGLGPIAVTTNGQISQGETQIGRLAVTTFADTKGLVPIEGGVLLAGPTAGASPAVNPGVVQGAIESSNVSPLFEMVNLVQVSRAYEANQRVITNADQQTQKTIDALG
jgi:flagellar basal body rod protein FlgG